MGSLSVSIHTRLIHWQGLLVAVSLFNFWCQPTTAQLAIASTFAAEGKDVFLHIRNKPPNVSHILWFKGEDMETKHLIGFLSEKQGSHLRGSRSLRRVVTRDGSLLIKNVSKADSGIYTISVQLTDSTSQVGHGWLTVYGPELVVSLVASNTTVTENKDTVILTCNTNALYIHWLFQGRHLNLNERMKISRNHRTITINPVKREDAGYYWCEVTSPVGFTISSPIILNVRSE